MLLEVLSVSFWDFRNNELISTVSVNLTLYFLFFKEKDQKVLNVYYLLSLKLLKCLTFFISYSYS